MTGPATIKAAMREFLLENPESTAHDVSLHLMGEGMNVSPIRAAKLLLRMPTVRFVPVNSETGGYVNIYRVIPRFGEPMPDITVTAGKPAVDIETQKGE